MARKSEKAYQTEKAIFASRLKTIMNKRGLNQTHLQEKISMQTGKTLQRQTISLYMNGQSKPDTERLLLLCNALDVSADYLIGLSQIESPNTDLQGVCKFTGLAEEAVENLCIIDESYSDTVMSAVNMFLSSVEMYRFFSSLWSVGECTKSVREHFDNYSIHELCSESAEKLRYLMETDFYTNLYRLSDSVISLASELYDTESLKKRIAELDKISAEKKFQMEAGNGKHQED